MTVLRKFDVRIVISTVVRNLNDISVVTYIRFLGSLEMTSVLDFL